MVSESRLARAQMYDIGYLKNLTNLLSPDSDKKGQEFL